MLFALLQQRSSMPMHNALWDTGRTGRIHDVQRVIEIDRRDLKRRIIFEKILPEDCVVDTCICWCRRYEWHHNRLHDRRDRHRDAGHCLTCVASLTVVEIGIGRKQNLWLDLTETINNSVGAEVR